MVLSLSEISVSNELKAGVKRHRACGSRAPNGGNIIETTPFVDKVFKMCSNA
jgi:hypothetical protein